MAKRITYSRDMPTEARAIKRELEGMPRFGAWLDDVYEGGDLIVVGYTDKSGGKWQIETHHDATDHGIANARRLCMSALLMEARVAAGIPTLVMVKGVPTWVPREPPRGS